MNYLEHIFNNSQAGHNTIDDLSTSYHFEIIPDYGNRETLVTMSSNSKIHFLIVK